MDSKEKNEKFSEWEELLLSDEDSESEEEFDWLPNLAESEEKPAPVITEPPALEEKRTQEIQNAEEEPEEDSFGDNNSFEITVDDKKRFAIGYTVKKKSNSFPIQQTQLKRLVKSKKPERVIRAVKSKKPERVIRPVKSKRPECVMKVEKTVTNKRWDSGWKQGQLLSMEQPKKRDRYELYKSTMSLKESNWEMKDNKWDMTNR